MSQTTAKPDKYLRRRLCDLQEQMKRERQQELSRALDWKVFGDQRKADYHTGLADGHNSVLAALRTLTSDYPADRLPLGADS